MHVCQTPVDAIVPERQSLVIEPQQVEDGRVQVMHRRHILDGFEAQFVRRSVANTTLHARTCQYRRKPVRIMVATFRSLLKHRHAAELGTPHDQRVF